MALGTQSVLGISSNLTWDVIEQMKDLDVSNQIDPITKKLEKNMEQQTELTSLLTMMTLRIYQIIALIKKDKQRWKEVVSKQQREMD